MTIDSNLNDILEVNQTSFVRGPRLKRNQWDRLGTILEAQDIWDSLSAEAKKIILEPRLGGPPPPRAPRTENLHDIRAHDYLQANLHNLNLGTDAGTNNAGHVDTKDTDGEQSSVPPRDDQLLAHMTKGEPLPPTDIQRILSSSLAKKDASPKTEITINGKVYQQAHAHITNTVYHASNHRSNQRDALIDRGANGGIAGADFRIIDKTGQFVDVQGIDNHQMVDIPIVTAGTVIQTQQGEVIAILHQYAHAGKGKTVHSSGQLEWFKHQVDDKSVKVGGQQRITTHEGHVIPINFRSGLPYITMRPYTDDKWDSLPHVIFTSP
jgi:hypothetical protein